MNTTNGHARHRATSADEMKSFLQDMLLVRRFEERAGQLYGMGAIGGFCHLYIGQEAVAVGARAAMSDRDQWISTYRSHAFPLLSGVEPRFVMAELTGRAAGMNKGKGGSMHMFAPDKKFYGGHGIVGANVPLGAGIAFANKYRGDDAVCLTFFGDGAANQGQVYETFNMAKLWSLPVIFIIENNQYAMGTSVQRSSSETHLHRRGAGFGIPGEEVDGMDVLAVRDAVMGAMEFVREGSGPMILEMKTYRFRGHSMSDPAKYRTKDEVKSMRDESDPIARATAVGIRENWFDEDWVKSVDKEIRKQVTDAAEFAQEMPEPALDALYEDVYAERLGWAAS